MIDISNMGWTPAHAHDLAQRAGLDSLKEKNNVYTVYADKMETDLVKPHIVGLDENNIKFTGPVLINPQPNKFPSISYSPELLLTKLAGVVCLPGGVVAKNNHIITHSFNSYMHWENGNLLKEEDKKFRLLKPEESKATPLEGTYLWLDNQYIPSWEAFVLQVLPQIWAAQVLNSIEIDYKLLVSPHITREQGDILCKSLGISQDKIVPVTSPIAPSSVLFATPSLVVDGYISEMAGILWNTVREKTQTSLSQDMGFSKIYLSRRKNTHLPLRTLLNEEEVEVIFAKQGFEIIFPEEHSFCDLIHLCQEAKWIAGSAGKATLALAFGSSNLEPRKTMILNSPNLVKITDVFFASVTNADLTLVYGQSNTNGVHDSWSLDPTVVEECVENWLYSTSQVQTHELIENTDYHEDSLIGSDVTKESSLKISTEEEYRSVDQNSRSWKKSPSVEPELLSRVEPIGVQSSGSIFKSFWNWLCKI